MKGYIPPLIVLAQFFCTSLWFAGNAIMPDLILKLGLEASDLGFMTSSVQLGFISGTLVYAIFVIADRYHPSRVFFISACLGALCNYAITWELTFAQILSFRFFTGFFLAGIYPVGMKIASDYYEKGLGKALGYLVGALVLGTALPHLLAGTGTTLDWKGVMISTSAVAFLGGLLIWLFVPEGPYRKKGSKLDRKSIFRVFDNPPFKGASFGYFGHMWELYAFWSFVPILIETHQSIHQGNQSISLYSFLAIGGGALSCMIGGLLSQKQGEKKVASISLLISGICCLISPLAFQLSWPLFLVFLLVWGLSVISDSPLFSSLVAKNAQPEIKGTALTIVTCLGFAVTIVSIQLLSYLVEISPIYAYLVLILGPIFGLWSVNRFTSASS